MTVLTTRLIVAAESQPDPLNADNPQLLFIHDRAGINIDPVAVRNGPAPLDGAAPDLWDMLVGARYDKEGLVVVYEAELMDNGGIVVTRNILEDYGLREYPHNWGGWPLPGDEEKPPPEPEVDPPPPEADSESKLKEALARKDDAAKTLTVRRNRK